MHGFCRVGHGRAGFPEADQLFDKLAVMGDVLVTMARIDRQVAHHGFLIAEMVSGVFRQLTEKCLQAHLGNIPLHHFIAQRVNRFDELLVLRINKRDARLETRIPDKGIQYSGIVLRLSLIHI